MWIRWTLALGLALAINAGLFAALSGLVRRHVAPAESVAVARIEFTRLRNDTEVKRIEREKLEREPTAPMPSAPRIAVAASFDRSSAALELGDPGVGARIALSRPDIQVAGSDRDVIPLVRIQPDYPPRAQARGLEGWVQVRFTITPAGTVQSPVVVDAEPEGVFDRAAIQAVLRWKYNPKVEAGVAVERRGVEVLLSFKMER